MNDNERLRTAEKFLKLFLKNVIIKPADEYLSLDIYYNDISIHNPRAFIMPLHVEDKETYEDIKKLLETWRTYEKE